MTIQKVPVEGIERTSVRVDPLSHIEATVKAVNRHPVDVSAGGYIGLGPQQPAVTELAHAERAGQLAPSSWPFHGRPEGSCDEQVQRQSLAAQFYDINAHSAGTIQDRPAVLKRLCGAGDQKPSRPPGKGGPIREGNACSHALHNLPLPAGFSRAGESPAAGPWRILFFGPARLIRVNRVCRPSRRAGDANGKDLNDIDRVDRSTSGADGGSG